MDPETLLHALFAIHDGADTPEEAEHATEIVLAEMEGEGGEE